MIIVCGGRGKRMGKITNSIPKPMIKIGKKPIIEHKIRYYQTQGINNFIFCLGYKSKILKKFLIKKTTNSIFNDSGLIFSTRSKYSSASSCRLAINSSWP